MKLNFKGLIIDKEEYTVKIKGEKLILPRKEFELLFMLSSNTGKVIKREEIMNQIWGEDVIVGDRTIDVHYLLPFIPFWSMQHYTGDIDNVQMGGEIICNIKEKWDLSLIHI